MAWPAPDRHQTAGVVERAEKVVVVVVVAAEKLGRPTNTKISYHWIKTLQLLWTIEYEYQLTSIRIAPLGIDICRRVTRGGDVVIEPRADGLNVIQDRIGVARENGVAERIANSILIINLMWQPKKPHISMRKNSSLMIGY